MGWWKSIKDWYVRLNKVKSGQAAKRYTDREQFILDNCKFYRTQLPSTVSAPMASLQRSEPIPQESVDSEPDSDHEPFDGLQVAERTSAETGHTYCSESRPSKKRKRGEQEEEKTWMKDLRETLKANQELLAHLIQEKPAQSSEREVFIKYVSDSLRAAPAEQYKHLKTHISALLDADSQETAVAPQPARPAQATSAPPVLQLPEQYQQSQQYQQQAPQYEQYQQQAPQYQLFQQSQVDQQRLSASTFTNLLNTSQDVLNGSINLSGFSVDSQLNTPPPPPREKDQAEKDGDSD